MIRVSHLWTIGFALLLGAAGPARAQGLAPEPDKPSARAPSALVEEVSAKDAGIAEMDYLAPGQIVQLAKTWRLVIDYMDSCLRETITGGVVMIGPDQSRVIGGTVEREHLPCGAGKLQLSAQQAAQSGGVVMRKLPVEAQIDRTLHGLSPVVDVQGASRLVVERLDRPEPRIEIAVGAADLVRGTFYDFARAGRRLAPGGIYRIEVGEGSAVFRIAPDATGDGVPLLSRLLRP